MTIWARAGRAHRSSTVTMRFGTLFCDHCNRAAPRAAIRCTWCFRPLNIPASTDRAGGQSASLNLGGVAAHVRRGSRRADPA
jgi:hypothetical protein